MRDDTNLEESNGASRNLATLVEHTSCDPLSASDVKSIRERLGWTQTRLANAMGMPQQSVSRAERETGLQGAHAKLLRILAKCCGDDP